MQMAQNSWNFGTVFHLRMHQLQVIQDKQAISAADLTWEQYIFCGPTPGMFLLILCLSLMTSDNSHGSLPTARFRTCLLQ